MKAEQSKVEQRGPMTRDEWYAKQGAWGAAYLAKNPAAPAPLRPEAALGCLQPAGWRSLADSQVDEWAGLPLEAHGMTVAGPRALGGQDGRPVSVGAGPGTRMGWRVSAGQELELAEAATEGAWGFSEAERESSRQVAQNEATRLRLGEAAVIVHAEQARRVAKALAEQAAWVEAARPGLGRAEMGVPAGPGHELSLQDALFPSAERACFVPVATPDELDDVTGVVLDWVKSWDEEHVVRGCVARLGADPGLWPDWELRALTQTFIDRGWL